MVGDWERDWMLSLGSRDEGRKGVNLGLGFRSREGAMEENELEEGEAFSGHEDDACIDPDIALSYIVRNYFFSCV